MPDIIQLGLDPIDGRLVAYYDELLLLSQQALTGELNERQYQTSLRRLVQQALGAAFTLAGGDVTVEAAVEALRRELDVNRRSINTLSGDIFDGRYSANDDQTAGRGVEKLENRLALWVYSAAGVYHLGQEFAPANQRFVWNLGNTEDHCVTCAGLSGVVLTAAEWQALRHRPQGRSLACGGHRCDCNRRPTERPSVGLREVRV